MGQQEMVSGPATEGRSSTLKAHQPILEKGSTVLLLQLLLLLLLLLRHAQGNIPMDSEMGWTGEVWLNCVVLTLEN